MSISGEEFDPLLKFRLLDIHPKFNLRSVGFGLSGFLDAPGLLGMEADFGAHVGPPGNPLPGQIEVDQADCHPAGERRQRRSQEPRMADAAKDPPVADRVQGVAYRHFSGYAATLRYWPFFRVILNDLSMNDHEMERELKGLKYWQARAAVPGWLTPHCDVVFVGLRRNGLRGRGSRSAAARNRICRCRRQMAIISTGAGLSSADQVTWPQQRIFRRAAAESAGLSGSSPASGTLSCCLP